MFPWEQITLLRMTHSRNFKENGYKIAAQRLVDGNEGNH